MAGKCVEGNIIHGKDWIWGRKKEKHAVAYC